MCPPPQLPSRYLIPVTALSVVAVGLVVARASMTGVLHFRFLLWNLFLAWVPYLLSLAMLRAHRTGRPTAVIAALGVPWLAFLPNAPYLVTDLIHLRQRSVPLEFDAALLGVFALAGLALGMVSLRHVHHVVAARFGTPWGWVMALSVLALSAVGILLGRVYRFNSWDVVTDPNGLIEVFGWWLLDPFGDPGALAFLVVGAAALLVAYLATWVITRPLRVIA